MANTFKSCIVEYDETGKCTKICELKTLSAEQIQTLKNQESEYLALKENEKNLKLKEKEEEEQKIADLLLRIIVILTKLQFNELVDSGETETTQEFEDRYNTFIEGGDFDYSNAPEKFISILERIKL